MNLTLHVLIQTPNSHTDNTYHIKLILIMVNHKQILIQFILKDKLTEKWLMISFFIDIFLLFFFSLPVLDWNIWAVVLNLLRSFLFYTCHFFIICFYLEFIFVVLSFISSACIFPFIIRHLPSFLSLPAFP